MIDKAKLKEAVRRLRGNLMLKDEDTQVLLSLAQSVLEGKLVEAVSVEEITETIRLEYNRQKEFGMEPSFVDLAQALHQAMKKGNNG